MRKGLLVLGLLLGSSFARPLLYTPKSVFNSAFCQVYQCTFVGSKVLLDPARGEKYRRYTYALSGGRMHITRDIQNHNITGVWYLITDGNLDRGGKVGAAALQAFLGAKVQVSDLLACWNKVTTLDGAVFYGDDTTTFGAKCFVLNRQFGFRIFANS